MANIIGSEIDYNLSIHGLFGRNRKPKLETFVLKTQDASTPALTTQEVVDLARAKLAEIRAKPGAQYYVNAVKSDIEEYKGSDGRVVHFKTTLVSLFKRDPPIIRDEVR